MQTFLSHKFYQLTYVIEKSQQVSLELYKLEGTPPAGGTMLLNYTPDPNKDEDFLGERIGYLYGIRVTDNVAPLIPQLHPRAGIVQIRGAEKLVFFCPIEVLGNGRDCMKGKNPP
mgnify:CR=1 FL=1